MHRIMSYWLTPRYKLPSSIEFGDSNEARVDGSGSYFMSMVPIIALNPDIIYIESIFF